MYLPWLAVKLPRQTAINSFPSMASVRSFNRHVLTYIVFRLLIPASPALACIFRSLNFGQQPDITIIKCSLFGLQFLVSEQDSGKTLVHFVAREGWWYPVSASSIALVQMTYQWHIFQSFRGFFDGFVWSRNLFLIFHALYCLSTYALSTNHSCLNLGLTPSHLIISTSSSCFVF